MLWKSSVDTGLLDKIREHKRESRFGNENSEDALTWNVFRAFERANSLNALASILTGSKLSQSFQTIYWTANSQGKPFIPFLDASKHYNEADERRSESDVILYDGTGENLIIIEAKFGSGNFNNKYAKPGKERELRINRYSQGEKYLKAPAGEILTAGWYQLMRNWLIGCYMQEQNPFKNFYLINLVRDGREENIEQEFGKFIKADKNRFFFRRTWEDIYRNLPAGADFSLLKQYFENKTLSMQKAFNI